MVNLSSHILRHAARSPNNVAIIYGDERIRYAEFADRILHMAGYMQECGIRQNDVVAAVMKNSTAFLDIAYAASHIGAVFLPVNFRLTPEEIQYIVGDARAKLLFADAEFEENICGFNPTVFVNEDAQRNTFVITSTARRAQPTPRNPEDLFRLMYTSGTTDRPKGVMHTYQNFHWKCWDHIIELGISASDRLLVAGPLYHVGAFDCPGVAILMQGGAMTILRNFNPREVLIAIERESLTCAWMAPVMIGRVLACEDHGRYDVSSLKWCAAGGEKTPENRIRQFSSVFVNARYIDAYGLTETCGGDTFMEPGMEFAKIGSTGRAVGHLEISICNENGQALEQGTEGEICLRGPKVTKGYWNDEEKTRNSFFGDWFRTGDLGRLDADGFLYLTDRIKDMIITGGENVASTEVERVIYQLKQVADVAVVGLPDMQWGERVVAVVELVPGETLTTEDLVSYCKSHLASFKVPKEIAFMELPRNPSGKVLKRVIRKTMTIAAQCEAETPP